MVDMNFISLQVSVYNPFHLKNCVFLLLQCNGFENAVQTGDPFLTFRHGFCRHFKVN